MTTDRLADNELRKVILQTMTDRNVGAIYTAIGWCWPVDIRTGDRSLLNLSALALGISTHRPIEEVQR